jgi:hypothetical protein
MRSSLAAVKKSIRNHSAIRKKHDYSYFQLAKLLRLKLTWRASLLCKKQLLQFIILSIVYASHIHIDFNIIKKRHRTILFLFELNSNNVGKNKNHAANSSRDTPKGSGQVLLVLPILDLPFDTRMAIIPCQSQQYHSQQSMTVLPCQALCGFLGDFN